MAKKTVATLQTGTSKKVSKVIRMVKSKKSNAYVFEEKIVNADKVNDFFSQSK